MPYACFLLTTIVLFNGIALHGSDQLMCREELPNPASLAAHILDWPAIIRDKHKQSCEVKPQFDDFRQGTTVSFQAVVRFEQRYKVVRKEDAYYIVLHKEDGQAKIVYHDFAKTFTVEHFDIQKIGYFLSSGIASTMREISLEHTALTSLEEIQNTIVSQCPNLKTLNVSHNKLQGTMSVHHNSMTQFKATHNNFSALGLVHLPNALLVDLRYNPTMVCIDAPDTRVGLLCKFLIDNPGDVLEVEQEVSPAY